MKTRITVTIDNDLKGAVEVIALADRRDLSAEICVLVEEAIKARATKKERA